MKEREMRKIIASFEMIILLWKLLNWQHSHPTKVSAVEDSSEETYFLRHKVRRVKMHRLQMSHF